MQKDLKTGMALGLVLVTAAALWLSTRPSLSTKARMLQSQNVESRLAQDRPLTKTAHEIVTEQGNTPDFTAHYTPEKIKTRRFHIVRKGETLSDISYRYYGSANKWKKILEANRFRLKDASKLKPGTKLTIPD